MLTEEFIRLIFLGILLVFLITIFFSRSKMNIGQTFKNSFLWCIIFFICIILYAFRFEIIDFKERILAVLIPSYSWSNQEGNLMISRSRDGHFYLYVQGKSKQNVKFLIDTGATNIALTLEDARALGVNIKSLRYTQKYNTANG
ncbi:MAG: hypothetical protein DGJ47_001037, partial [Rickettsiaceae bacterium]